MTHSDFHDDDEYRHDNCGFAASDDIRVGYISGLTFTRKQITYSMVGGKGTFEGCIVVGTQEEIERREADARAAADAGDLQQAVVISDESKRWPDALMPYEINASLPNQARVTDAIAHWTANTNMRFVQRTSGNAAQYPNFVRFVPSEFCRSSVGMVGGMQEIELAAGCSTGSTIHEIGHAWGLWHEQSREDRDDFVTINWSNIEDGRQHNFNQHISDGTDIGAYDYGSIMHYGRTAFSKNGQPTIEPKQAGVSIGQRTALSQRDIDAVHFIYKTWWNGVRVYDAFASHDRENAWANLEGLGWRKVEPKSPDGVTNMFLCITEAVANNLRIDAYADGTTLEILYL